MKSRHLFKAAVHSAAVLSLVLVASAAFAEADLASMANKIRTQATAIAVLLNVTAYVAGVGFALAGILQFKAHKENAQQVPLSKPVVMIVVAACLLFLPSIMEIAGASLFENGQRSVDFRSMDGR